MDKNTNRTRYNSPYYVMIFLLGILLVSCNSPNSTSPEDNSTLTTAAVTKPPNTKALVPVNNLIQAAIWNDYAGELMVSVSLLVTDGQVKIVEAESLVLIDEHQIYFNEVWQSRRTKASLTRIPCSIQVNTQTRSQTINVLNPANNCGTAFASVTATIPTSIISSPPDNITITVGQSHVFSATIADPYNNGPYRYIWNYGGAAASVTGTTTIATTVKSNSIVFSQVGSYTISFRAADRTGIYPNRMSSRLITVVAGGLPSSGIGNISPSATSPTTIITSPFGSATVAAGNQMIFSGQISSVTGPYYYVWDFYYGSTLLKSVSGATSSFSISTMPVIFKDPGTYKVAFKAKTKNSPYNTSYPEVTVVVNTVSYTAPPPYTPPLAFAPPPPLPYIPPPTYPAPVFTPPTYPAPFYTPPTYYTPPPYIPRSYASPSPLYTPPNYPSTTGGYVPYATDESTLTKTDLGQALFFDTSLSEPAGQACASCHNPFTGWADSTTVSTGASGISGSRNTPSISYAVLSPSFSDTGPTGGLFWDGSAAHLLVPTKVHLLSSLAMNNPDKAAVIAKVRAAGHTTLFEQIYGEGALALDNTEAAFEQIADAIADFLASPFINPFASKFDLFLQGQTVLAADELNGMSLFNGKAGCSGCHTSTQTEQLPAFSNYSYVNLGVPENSAVDAGLDGRFKVPSLRNVAKTAPYMHNGVFDTLEAVIGFYNTRDSGLELTNEEQAQLIAFLKTLDDISVFTQ